MLNKTRRSLAVLTAVLAVSPVLTGCSASAPPLTKQEEANFKGGPMPPEAQKAFAERLRQNRPGPNAGAPPANAGQYGRTGIRGGEERVRSSPPFLRRR
jgi:hypothetical protein